MRYVRLRTFNRHRTKYCWYPTKRFYMVPLDCAADLGNAILAAAEGKPFGPQPSWWVAFEQQYEPFRSTDNNSGADQVIPRAGFESGFGVAVDE